MSVRLSPLERRALDAFAQGVRMRFGDRLDALTLFGSRARGEGRDDSDLDILVLAKDLSRKERRDILDLGADVGLEHHLVLSPLVFDAKAWRADLPLGRAIAHDGVAL